MKILHMIASLDPKTGGTAEAVRTLVLNRPAGVESHVLTLDPPDAPFLAGLPFPVHAMGEMPARWYSRRMLEWLRQHRDEYDAVILDALWGFTSVATLLEVAGRKPYGVFAHGMLDPWFKKQYPLKHLKKWFFWLTVQYWVLRRARCVFFTAPAEAELAKKSFWLWRWTPKVVPLGTELPAINPTRATEAFYGICPELQGKRFILYLGRIHPKKGCDLLLQAFSQLAEHSDTHLVIAGPDPQNWRAELTQMPGYDRISARVQWPGMLTGDPKWGAFLASEAFILPSHQENFGIAVAEALALGRPVLITDKVNIASYITEDGCGFVEPDTEAGVRRLLERWFALTPEQCEAMSQQTTQTFLQRFDMKRNAAEVFSVLASAPDSLSNR